MLNFEFFFINFQTYLESSVSFLYFSWLNDLLWLLYLSLDVVLVNPMYATCSFSENTVALYAMQLERQFPSSGHLVGCLQLHVFLLGSMMFFPFIIFALCALMICCMRISESHRELIKHLRHYYAYIYIYIYNNRVETR